MNYYNDNDPHAVKFLQSLIERELIPKGDVDDRSIKDVQPADLRGYTQCHFFAGIAGWSYALELAGWGTTRPVWTGSCPCQPFSRIGRQDAETDPRHLWPEFKRLIEECSPSVVFGEQVVSTTALRWMSTVRDDMEGIGYAVGLASLPACSIDAHHERQRLYWVSDFEGQGCSNTQGWPGQAGQTGWPEPDSVDAKQRACSWPDESSEVWVVDGLSRELAHQIKAYGNAIVPQVAAEFIAAYMETREK